MVERQIGTESRDHISLNTSALAATAQKEWLVTLE